jgi:hypothetical protein
LVLQSKNIILIKIKVMKKNLSITKLWMQAKDLFEQGKIDKADENLDWCLVILSKHALAGSKGTDLLEGTKMDVWYERIWCDVEKFGLLPE